MAELKIAKKFLRNAVTMLALDGDLDAHTAPNLETIIEKMVKEGSNRIVLDLRKLKYISSHGVGVLLSTYAQVHEHAGELVLLKPQPVVREVLDMLDASQLFSVVDDQPAAMAKF